jgi:hypothetical protein
MNFRIFEEFFMDFVDFRQIFENFQIFMNFEATFQPSIDPSVCSAKLFDPNILFTFLFFNSIHIYY